MSKRKKPTQVIFEDRPEPLRLDVELRRPRGRIKLFTVYTTEGTGSIDIEGVPANVSQAGETLVMIAKAMSVVYAKILSTDPELALAEVLGAMGDELQAQLADRARSAN